MRVLSISPTETHGATGPTPEEEQVRGRWSAGGGPECFPTETRGVTGPFPKEGAGPGHRSASVGPDPWGPATWA